MKTIKKLSQKHISLTWATCIALLTIAGITACGSPNQGTPSGNGNESNQVGSSKVTISASSTELQAGKEEVTLTFKLTEEAVAKLASFKLKINVQGGPGKIKYTAKGSKKKVTAGTEAEEPLAPILTKGDGTLKASEAPTMIVTFEPKPGANMVATFQVMDVTDGNKVISQTPPIKWKAAPDVTIRLKKEEKTTLKGKSEQQVAFTITAGPENLTEKDLQAVSLAYKASKQQELWKGYEIANGKNLHELLGVSTLQASSTTDLVLIIDNRGHAKATFKNIQLQGSKNEANNQIPQITWEWEGKIDLKISCKRTTLHGPRAEASIKLTNMSGIELKKEQLEKVIFRYTALEDGVKLTKDEKDANGQSLWDLRGKEINAGAAKHIYLAVEHGSQRSAEFTKIWLTDVDQAEIASLGSSIKWGVQLKVKLADPSPVALKGDERTFEVKFVNESGFTLTEMGLEQIKVVLEGTVSGQLKWGEKNDQPIISGTTTLADIFKQKLSMVQYIENKANGKSNPEIEKRQEVVIKFTLVPDEDNTPCNFTIKLVGSDSKETEKQITWQP